MQAKREWYNIFKVMIVKNLQLSVLYPVRLSFTFEGGIKSITDKQKPKESYLLLFIYSKKVKAS